MREASAPGSRGRKREIWAAAGERVTVIRRAFSSVPMEYRFSARPADPAGKLSGKVVVRKSRWIFPSPAAAPQPLQAHNVVLAGFWNTFLTAEVVADVDVVIRVERDLRHRAALLLAAAAVVAAAAAMLVLLPG